MMLMILSYCLARWRLQTKEDFWDLPLNMTRMSILFATRSRKVAVDAAGNRAIDVEQVSKEEAVILFERLFIHNDYFQDRDSFQELLDKLTCLPLAIAQAATYINKLEPTFSKYPTLLRASTGSLISLMGEEFVDHTPGLHKNGTYLLLQHGWYLSSKSSKQTFGLQNFWNSFPVLSIENTPIALSSALMF